MRLNIRIVNVKNDIKRTSECLIEFCFSILLSIDDFLDEILDIIRNGLNADVSDNNTFKIQIICNKNNITNMNTL